jgi:hypothetical protein
MVFSMTIVGDPLQVHTIEVAKRGRFISEPEIRRLQSEDIYIFERTSYLTIYKKITTSARDSESGTVHDNWLILLHNSVAQIRLQKKGKFVIPYPSELALGLNSRVLCYCKYSM